MAWKLNRSVALKRRLPTLIGDALSAAKWANATNAEESGILRERLWKPLDGAPAWLRAYAEGFLDCARSARFNGPEPDLIFAHGAPDGSPRGISAASYDRIARIILRR